MKKNNEFKWKKKKPKRDPLVVRRYTSILLTFLIIISLFTVVIVIFTINSLYTPSQSPQGIPEYLCLEGDIVIFNITDSTLPPEEDMSLNQSFRLTITDLNYSSRPNDDGDQIFHGAFVFANTVDRNGTGHIMDNVTDWSGCYNMSNINIGFKNVSYMINSSFFIAPTNFTAYVELMEIFFEFGFGMNVTENSSTLTRHNITAWNGTVAGDGAGVHAQKWNIMFDATKNIADEIHIWNWTGSVWSSIINGSAIYKSWI